MPRCLVPIYLAHISDSGGGSLDAEKYFAAGLQDVQPPKAPDMFVRVLQDCGNVAFSTGSVTLKKGSTHFLPRAEADHLIQEGVLAPSESGPIEAFTTPFDYI